jgi:putative SbcD/Mre11-related phosphoesterase
MHLELIQNEPALLLHEGERRVLVVGDLHIGYERTLFKQEFYSVNLASRIIKQFEHLVEKSAPTEIIILGDLKHSIRDFSPLEFQQVAQLLLKLQQQATVTIVRGNHDADLELVVPDDTHICSSAGLRLSFKSRQIYLLHGHAYPSPDILSCDSLLMGHVHPAISISTLKEKSSIHRVWVKTKWKPTVMEVIKGWVGQAPFQNGTELLKRFLQMKILIIPAYLDLLRGHVLNVDSSNAHLDSPLFRHLALDDAEIIMLDLTPLGTLEQLKTKRTHEKETF